MDEYLLKFDNDITELDISHRKLDILPDLNRFTNLQKLYCNDNNITNFDDEVKVLPQIE